MGKEWVRVANLIVPYQYLNYSNYKTGNCVSSVYNTNGLFAIEFSLHPSVIHSSKEWYPHSNDADMRFLEMNLRIERSEELTIYDSHIVPSPLIVTHRSRLGTPASHVDVIFHEYNGDGTFSRYTANRHLLMYPERELCLSFVLLIYSPFWTGSVDMKLDGEQLHIEGYISTQDGTYNPYLPVYDSRTAMVMYLPRGVYIDLAEMKLMYDSGKIPAYFSYVTNVNTDLPYEEAQPQMIVFIAEATIYPLSDRHHQLMSRPPMLDINISLPIHFRASTTRRNVTIPLPAFFACSPVKDTILVEIGSISDA